MKDTQISSFMKIRLLGAEFFHTDRQAEMTKLIVAFRNFANAPKKYHDIAVEVKIIIILFLVQYSLR